MLQLISLNLAILVLQCCSVIQCDVFYGSELHCAVVRCRMLQCVAVCPIGFRTFGLRIGLIACLCVCVRFCVCVCVCVYVRVCVSACLSACLCH